MKNKLLHFWNKISENGISDDLDIAEKKRIRVLNRIILINALLAFIFLIIDIVNSNFASNFVAISISFTTFTFSPILFLLLMKKYYKVAKWTVIFIFVFFISFVAILTGKDSGIILFFIPGILFPTILFQRKKNILILTSLIIGVLIVVLFINQIYNPQLITSQSELNFYFISNIIGCAILTLLVIWYFKSTNSEYEKIITEKNKSLNNYNIEINEQKLKLEAKNIENEQLVENLESIVQERTLSLQKTMEAIKIKDNKTRTIVDNALDGILLVSKDWKILEWNKQTKKILKIVKEKRGEYSLFDFIANTKDQKKEDIIRICEKTQKDGNSLRQEIIALTAKHENLDLEVSLTFTDTIDGVEGIIFIKDITEQKKSEKNRQALQEQILKLNASLEKEVDQKTQENIKLSEKIVNQERLVLAGEIAGTVAHELNTPLGAIVAGSEGMKENIELLFSKLLPSCSSEEIEFAFSLNLDLSFSLFVGGRKALKKKAEIKELLIKQYNVSEESLKELSELFFKTNLSLNKKQNILYILNSKTPKKLLQLILAIGTIRFFLETTVESSKRSAAVIQNIKKSLSVTRQKADLIDLKQNILSVVKLFRHDIERIADLEISIDNNLFIQGVDFQLFQLWTNILKNAIFAIKENPGDKKIAIIGKKENETAVISITNNGPKIPEGVKDKIFEKFYTTKDQKGSGLGLGIVQNVASSHQAKITLNSSEKETCFQFLFKLKEG